MTIDAFIDKLHNLKQGSLIEPNELVRFVQELDADEIKQLAKKIEQDGDAQERVKINLKNVLQTSIDDLSVIKKINEILLIIEELYKKVIEPSSVADLRTSELKDHEFRLQVLRKISDENAVKIRELQESTAIVTELQQNMKNAQEELSTVKGELKNAQDDLNKAKGQLEDTIKQSKSALIQSIEVLGIFVAIITIFLGGFSEISLVGSMKELNTYKFFLFVLVTGHIIINTIFMFFYMLCRVINKPVASNCTCHKKVLFTETENESSSKKTDIDICYSCCFNKEETSDKNSKCSLLNRVKNKYPYVYYFNRIVFIFEFLICLGWFFSEEIFSLKGEPWFLKFSSLIVVGVVAIAFLKKDN